MHAQFFDKKGTNGHACTTFHTYTRVIITVVIIGCCFGKVDIAARELHFIFYPLRHPILHLFPEMTNEPLQFVCVCVLHVEYLYRFHV